MRHRHAVVHLNFTKATACDLSRRHKNRTGRSSSIAGQNFLGETRAAEHNGHEFPASMACAEMDKTIQGDPLPCPADRPLSPRRGLAQGWMKCLIPAALILVGGCASKGRYDISSLSPEAVRPVPVQSGAAAGVTPPPLPVPGPVPIEPAVVAPIFPPPPPPSPSYPPETRPPRPARAAVASFIEAPGRAAPASLENYVVEVSASRTLRIPGPPGVMRVWIGDEQFRKGASEGQGSASTTVPALGNTARITPFAPGMEVTPKENECIRIDRTGSELQFQIVPAAKGRYAVGANISLYALSDCSGPAIPKTARAVEVEVEVAMEDGPAPSPPNVKPGSDSGLLDELVKETKKAIVDFWGQLLAMAFAFCLFLARKHVLARFGFEGGK